MKKRTYAVNSGQKFGRLTAVKMVDSYALVNPSVYQTYVWYCRCDCGGYIRAKSIDLSSGGLKKCNACGAEYKEPELLDLTGKTFGDLTVVQELASDVEKSPNRWWQQYYLVRCACGRLFRTRQRVLLEGFRTACEVCEPKERH